MSTSKEHVDKAAQEILSKVRKMSPMQQLVVVDFLEDMATDAIEAYPSLGEEFKITRKDLLRRIEKAAA